MGSGASSNPVLTAPQNPAVGRTSYWCHQCQTTFDRLEGGLCPGCRGGFVEEAAPIAVLAQTARWLERTGVVSSNSTEARIARLLDDLHTHLELVEGLHESMRRAMEDSTSEDANRPRVDPAPPEVLAAVGHMQLEGALLKSMRQTAQCVICCADFEVGEQVSQLPGCSHLFHPECISQWLERASNCPICRQDLVEAVGAKSPEPVGVVSEDQPSLSTLVGGDPHPLRPLLALSREETSSVPAVPSIMLSSSSGMGNASEGRTMRRSDNASVSTSSEVSASPQHLQHGVGTSVGISRSRVLGTSASVTVRNNNGVQVFSSSSVGSNVGSGIDAVAAVRRPPSSSVLVGAGNSTLVLPSPTAASGQPLSPTGSSGGPACDNGVLPLAATASSVERQTLLSRGRTQRR